MNKIFVKYDDRIVGTLALTKEKTVAFQYSEDWLENGFSVSPFSLPLKSKVFVPSNRNFNGLFGVFADSLPDSWGNLLLDRIIKKYGLNDNEFTVIDKLSFIGNNGMGILSYEPVKELNLEQTNLTLDQLNLECKKILSSKESYNLDEIYRLGGSSGGARPKVLIEYNGTPWIVKFSNNIDYENSGYIEFKYFECAKACGINVPQTKLFNSKTTSGYFGIERFDRFDGKKIHMISVAALLELDFRVPSLDYKDLIKLTKILTNDEDAYEMFRRMCFNVFAHNLDDHTKNFSFIYNQTKRCWQLSPAYDLTYSNTYFGEHTTSVNGKGKNITDLDLLKVGMLNNLNKNKCLAIISEIKKCVHEMLDEIICKF